MGHGIRVGDCDALSRLSVMLVQSIRMPPDAFRVRPVVGPCACAIMFTRKVVGTQYLTDRLWQFQFHHIFYDLAAVWDKEEIIRV